MDRKSTFSLFIGSLFRRYGGHIFYDQRFMDNDMNITFPWWSRIVFWTERWADRFYFIRQILSFEGGWLRYEHDYGYSAPHKATGKGWIRSRITSRLFYMVKAVLCLLFFYTRKFPEGYWHLSDWINVACFDFHPSGGEYGGDGWEQVDVGYGLFRNWYVRDFHDSSC